MVPKDTHGFGPLLRLQQRVFQRDGGVQDGREGRTFTVDRGTNDGCVDHRAVWDSGNKMRRTDGLLTLDCSKNSCCNSGDTNTNLLRGQNLSGQTPGGAVHPIKTTKKLHFCLILFLIYSYFVFVFFFNPVVDLI